MNRALAILIFTLLFFLSAKSQAPTFRWAKSFGSVSADQGVTTVADAFGNVYVMGIFNLTTDMDPGPGVYNLTSSGQADIFISKFDSSGDFLWAKQIGNSFQDNCRSMNIDNNGNIYLTGLFYSTVDFDPGPGVYNLICSTTGYAAFLLKLDSGGNFVWAKELVETNYGNIGGTVAIAPSGNVYVAGEFKGTGDFDPGPGVFNLTSMGSVQDIFISKFDNNGNFIWANQIAGPDGEVCYSIVLDATENIYTTGVFYGTCDFDPGPGIFNLTANNVNSGSWSDAFILKLNINGNFIFAKQIFGEFDDISRSIVLDASGNVLITGEFSGITDFDPGPATFYLDAGPYSDAYLLKLDDTGSLVWVSQFASGSLPASTSQGFSIAVDNQGNIYTIGVFSGEVDFNPGVTVNSLTSLGQADFYVSKLNPTGNFLFTQQVGGNGFTAGLSEFIALPGNILITGYFTGTTDFDPTPGMYNLTSLGSGDVFVLKLKQPCNQSTSSTLTVSACNSYTLNGQTYSNTGTYSQTLINGIGCDSIITLNLTLSGSNDTTSLAACDSYIWNGQTYTASGFYRDTLINIYGCDSILNLDLTIKNSVTTTINVTICEGQVYAGHTISGTYIDSYVAANGCDSIRTLYLTVNPKSFATINAVICEGQSYAGHTVSGSYTDTYVAANGCDSIRTLNLVVNLRKFTSVSAAICQGQSYFAGGANQTTSGIYKDTLLTSLGCDSVITTTLLVNPNPQPDLGSDKSLCAGASVTFNPGSFNTYLWQDMSTLPAFTASSTGLFWVTVTDNNNCSARDSVRINAIIPLPANFLKPTDSVCSYDKLILQPLSSYRTYQWSTGATQSSITVQTPGQYWLMVSDINGCSGTDTISVFPKQCITGVFIPTAFTPNGDGKNDIFKAIIYGNTLSFSLEVFDRAGQLVFRTTNPLQGWSGLYGGIPSSVKVFVWQCSYQLEGEKVGYQKGTVTLIR